MTTTSTDAFLLLHDGVKHAIWDMRWEELRPIQARAIRQIYGSDSHLLICAQTAGGKTEAAFLPIISRIASEPKPSVQALYISPLKALINDQFRRLEELCERVEIPVWRWHGDVSASDKAKLRKNPSGILLITPESLESNFVNYGNQIGRIYRHIDFIVIDELHAFLGAERGAHLRSLMCRLAHATGKNPKKVGLSATVGDPDVAREFMAPDAPEEVDLIEETGNQEIRYRIFGHLDSVRYKRSDNVGARLTPAQAVRLAESAQLATLEDRDKFAALCESALDGGESDGEPLRDAMDDVADEIVEKFAKTTNLVFINSKQQIEILADRLVQRVKREKWPHDPFLVHHGSLSKEIREEAEAALKKGGAATAICSSTLELGIDIGDVRAVGQVGAPWSVASLRQRLGRSGRREGQPAIMRMHVVEPTPNEKSDLSDLLYPDLIRAIALTELMLEKWLEPNDSDRLHLSTLVHQILSCLRQTGGTGAKQLFGVLVERGAFTNVSKEQFLLLLRGLRKSDLIEQTPTGEIILAPDGERVVESWEFYAAFLTSADYSVRHGQDEIGHMPATNLPAVGEHLILAGRRWRLTEVVDRSRLAYVEPSSGALPPAFAGDFGDTHPRVAEKMRAVLCGEYVPSYLDANAQEMLKAARLLFRKCGLEKRPLLVRQKEVQWFPWSGTRVLLTLICFARHQDLKTTVDSLSITYRDIDLSAFMKHLDFITNAQILPEEIAAELPVKHFEKFDPYLLDELLNHANAVERLDLNGARESATDLLAHGQIH